MQCCDTFDQVMVLIQTGKHLVSSANDLSEQKKKIKCTFKQQMSTAFEDVVKIVLQVFKH
jgi:hypothetical protein